MLLIRRFEEKAGQLFALGDIGGHCRLGIGREAIAVGLAMASGSQEPMIAASRHHGDLLARGVDPKRVMAELAGRADGCAGGKAGSLHLFAPEVAIFGGQGLGAPTATLAAGLAFAGRYRGLDQAVWCHVGEGQAGDGDVFEALELAVSLQLPLVLLLESYVRDEMSNPVDLSQRGRGLGVPGWQVDGTDVVAVRDAAGRAAAWSRTQRLPFILEMITPSYRGHSMVDPLSISCRDTAALRALNDPIAHVKLRLIEAGLSERDLRSVDAEVRNRIDDAVDFALESPDPGMNTTQ